MGLSGLNAFGLPGN